MIIFIDDDLACRHWLTHHRTGYVLEGMRNRRSSRLLLHKAVCATVKDEIGKGRATTHGRWVACSLNDDDLSKWCVSEYAVDPARCESCFSMEPRPPREEQNSLSPLARNVLDYLLDVAVIHLEPDARPYSLKVSNIAQCLRKSAGQLSSAFDQLCSAGLVVLGSLPKTRRSAFETQEVYPTARGLKTLPYFADWDERRLDLEIARLTSADSR